MIGLPKIRKQSVFQRPEVLTKILHLHKTKLTKNGQHNCCSFINSLKLKTKYKSNVTKIDPKQFLIVYKSSMGACLFVEKHLQIWKLFVQNYLSGVHT